MTHVEIGDDGAARGRVTLAVEDAGNERTRSASRVRRKRHIFPGYLPSNEHRGFAPASPDFGILALMLKLRNIPNFLCVVLPAFTWVACGSDSDDSSSAGAGGVTAGAGGSSAGKGGGGSTGKAGAGTGAQAGAPEETAGEGGSSGEAGSTPLGGSAGTAGGGGGAAPIDPLTTDVNTIVFIYAENRSFDGLYGNFPERARAERSSRRNRRSDCGLRPAEVIVTARPVLTKLPKTWTGDNRAGQPDGDPRGDDGRLWRTSRFRSRRAS